MIRVSILLLVALAALLGDTSFAYAQSASCSRLQSTLRTFERNRDFRNYQQYSREAQQLAQQVQDGESTYVRSGCLEIQQSGQALPRQCRNLARQITRDRADYDDLARSVETGNAVAQQREAVLQEMARFGCNADGSGVQLRDQQDGEMRQERRSLFEQLFDSMEGDGNYDEGDIVGDQFTGYGNYNTVRTVCVRLSDGYFWPVSYSTLLEYAGNDATQCQEQCPGTQVELYYYANPGQEPEQMVNLYGQPYSALPSAFRYRKEFDKASSCKQKVDFGSISMAETTPGQVRPIITFNGQSFPMPPRDPRMQAVVTTVAVDETQFVTGVPLPRPRPAAPGQAKPVQAVAEQSAGGDLRVVQFGDKKVRIVGPDTPYARPAGAGT